MSKLNHPIKNINILKEQILDIASRMDSEGMNHGTSGNISARVRDGMILTPSSIPYKEMEAKDLLLVDLNGATLQRENSQYKPSSEWRIHADIYKHRQEINAVIHCHSINATAIACHGRKIPSFHYMVAIAGGEDIKCAKYATFGTAQLSKNTITALEERLACLLAQHGQVSIGKDLERAFNIAINVEVLANIYIRSSSLGEPKSLSKEEMELVIQKFKHANYC